MGHSLQKRYKHPIAFYAWLAKLAYRPYPVIEKFMAPGTKALYAAGIGDLCMLEGETLGNENSGVDGFIFAANQPGCRVKIYIVFRGTDFENLKDISVDLSARMTAYAGCVNESTKAHHGFKQAYASVKNEVSRIREFYETKYGAVDGYSIPDIVCAGHSYGGPLAVMAGMDSIDTCILERDVICSVYGAPRWANGVLVDAIENSSAYLTGYFNIFRFENPWDMVTMVPFWHWGYRKEGKVLKLKGSRGHGIDKYFDNLRHGRQKAIEEYTGLSSNCD